jgi:signal transduction histidine kinase
MNLLVNAAHAIQGISTEHKKGIITLRTGKDNDTIWVEIEDNGSGIDPTIVNKIFDPFFTTKPIGKGTGLGLSLSYGIVKKHQGTIEVRSELGVGTCFKITLPINKKLCHDP